MKRHIIALLAIAAFCAASLPVHAGAVELNAQMKALMESYSKAAGQPRFNAADGKKLFTSKRMHVEKKEDRGCVTCHTADPKAQGKTPVGKAIDPIAPVANKERFTDPKKVEKWFKRNCEWVLERECTPAEKGSFVTFMLSVE